VPPDFPVEIIVAAVVILIIILAIAAAFSQPSINNEIAKAEEAALAARAEAQDVQRQAADIDRHIHAAEQDAYHQGRRAADREWQNKEWTRE
jgi:type II secretory pathway pseudopilin PulG